jgi:hypothetical protein
MKRHKGRKGHKGVQSESTKMRTDLLFYLSEVGSAGDLKGVTLNFESILKMEAPGVRRRCHSLVV